MSMDLATLRASLRRMSPGGGAAPAARDAVATGASPLDRALAAGGFPAGRLSELAGAPSSGKMALALTALSHHTRAGSLGAFVDGTAQLYPPAAAALGVELARLLWIRPRPAGDSIVAIARAIEVVAQSRAFALIVADLPGERSVDAALARRLSAAAHGGGAAILLLTSLPGAIPGAALRLETWSPEAGRVALRVAKGGIALDARAEVPLSLHRFDDHPAAALSPATRRPPPGAPL